MWIMGLVSWSGFRFATTEEWHLFCITMFRGLWCMSLTIQPEITGTTGTLKINLHPWRDLVWLADGERLWNEGMRDFYKRYDQAFVRELKCFAVLFERDRAAVWAGDDGERIGDC
jgi:hypothetical protein